MRNEAFGWFLALKFLQLAAAQSPSIEAAAARFVPDVVWRPLSVVTAGFSCQGRKQYAIPGASKSENQRYFVTRKIRHRSFSRRKIWTTTQRKTWDSIFPVSRRSRTCKGLNLTDAETDSAHIYWNHETRRFNG
jgi:hypothetical protein